jgi:hypothetical protein
MPRMPSAPAAALAGALALTALAGCATGDRDQAPAAPAAPEAPAAADGPIGVTAGGVTTRVDLPAQSTEEKYAQSCMAAKEWMAAEGGDPSALVEPYLEQIQSPGARGPATFGTTWADLSDPQRAAVILAVRAAADGGC